MPQFAALFEDVFAIDVSLMNELDDLHKPETLLLAAQELAAEVYGAGHSFFAVNGTSGALQAMLLGTLQEGDKLLLPRNAHRSIIGGLMIADARPIYLWPEFDTEFGIPLQPSPEDIADAFARQPDIKAVLLTSPSYYGVVADLKAIAKIVHKNGALLLVDEAHGAHLGFDSRLPGSALQAGADAAAQSTHKILGALTQCSLLHIQGPRIAHDKVARAMSMLTTTSPNQILLASLDAACYQLAVYSKEMLEQALYAVGLLRSAVGGITGLRLLAREYINSAGPYDLDETKVLINVREMGLSGFAVADLLRKEKIAVELADQENVLFLVTYADAEPGIRNAEEALKKIAARPHKGAPAVMFCDMPKPEAALTPRAAFQKKSQRIPLIEAVDRVAAEEITFYPPGIPLVLPGERISPSVVDYCLAYMAGSGREGPKYINVVLDDDKQ